MEKNHMRFFIVSTNKSQLHLHNIIFLVSFTVNGEKSILDFYRFKVQISKVQIK